MWRRLGIFLIISLCIYYTEYKIERHIEDKSWGGFGVVEAYGNNLSTYEFRRSLSNLDFSMWRMYAYYEMVDSLFCFFYAMLICDYLTICFANSPRLIQKLDLTPFLLAIIDFCENVCIIASIIQWPYGLSPYFIEMAVFLCTLKNKLTQVIIGIIIFGTLFMLVKKQIFNTKPVVKEKTKTQ